MISRGRSGVWRWEHRRATMELSVNCDALSFEEARRDDEFGTYRKDLGWTPVYLERWIILPRVLWFSSPTATSASSSSPTSGHFVGAIEMKKIERVGM